MLEIRIHGRAGQGAKTIAQFLAEIGLKKGKFIQAFPSYGPARTGAAMNAYVRLDQTPILVHSEIKNPDIVVVIDSLLIEVENVVKGLKNKGIVIMNSSRQVQEEKDKLVKRFGLNKQAKVYVLPASAIAYRILKKDLPNMVLLGALIKIAKIADFSDLAEVIKNNFIKKYGEKMSQANIEAAESGYKIIN
jgi:pyruvate ferredoxin oxidoreductase gamma subunit